jgi:hypothetical protein
MKRRLIRAATSTILALLLVGAAVTAFAGDKNSPQTGCDKVGAWCLYQRDDYQQESAKRAAREAAEAQALRSDTEQTRR